MKTWLVYVALVLVALGLYIASGLQHAEDDALCSSATRSLRLAPGGSVPIILDDCSVDVVGDGNVRIPLADFLTLERQDWFVNRTISRQSTMACRDLVHRHQEALRWLPIILDDCSVDVLGDRSIHIPLGDYLAMERSDWWVNRAARVMVDQHNSGDPMPLEWCLP